MREGEREREFVYVCAYVRASVRARVCARTLNYVTFVFIDEVFYVCVCV